jgi:hypothetical protein
MNKVFDKILPYEARAEFCQIFRSFLGNGVSRINAFEINWPLEKTYCTLLNHTDTWALEAILFV